MNALTDVYNSLQEDSIYLSDFKIPVVKATTIEIDNNYAIFIDYSKISTIEEEFCVMAHEYGHCATGSTHKLYSKGDLISRHEYRANKWAIHKFLPFSRYESALKRGCTEFWELAEYLELPEEFIRQADYIYKREGLLREFSC